MRLSEVASAKSWKGRRNMLRYIGLSGPVFLLLTCLGAARAQAPSVADFYKGKQVDFLIAGAPGEIYDQWARLMAQYLSHYIPGNPTILVRNMPGASDLVVTNYLYNIAARDGSVIGMV